MKIVKRKELYKRYSKYCVYNVYKQTGIDETEKPIWEYLYKTCEMNFKDKIDINETIINQMKELRV